MKQVPERPDCRRVAQHGTQTSIPTILDVAKAIAVLDERLPAGQIASPGPDVVVNAHVLSQDLSTPAVMVPGNPQHWNPRVHEIRERREYAKRGPRNYRTPLEPELEQVAIDDERPCSSRQMSKKREQISLDVTRRDAEMGVGEYVARRREHGDSLPKRRDLYKRTGSTHFRGRCSSIGAMAPIAHSLVVSED